MVKVEAVCILGVIIIEFYHQGNTLTKTDLRFRKNIAIWALRISAKLSSNKSKNRSKILKFCRNWLNRAALKLWCPRMSWVSPSISPEKPKTCSQTSQIQDHIKTFNKWRKIICSTNSNHLITKKEAPKIISIPQKWWVNWMNLAKGPKISALCPPPNRGLIGF